MRNIAKTALQNIGLFPIARLIHRRMNSSVRRQASHEISFYRPLLQPGGLCFDIGANLGQRTEIFLSLNQRVVTVEPNIHCEQTLKFLFKKNSNVQLVMKAVGNAEGFVDLYSHGTDSTASISPDWDKTVFGIDRGQIKSRVPMTTIDDLVDRYGLPNFTKIDVEGYELNILRGLSRSLPLLSFEYHHNDMTKTIACLDILSKLSPLLVRPSTMNCTWITEGTTNIDQCLGDIEVNKANGDLFVWMS